MSMQPPVGAGGEATTLVADIDRERVVDSLREHCADGRPAFAELADAASVARTVAGLPAVVLQPAPIAGGGRLERSLRCTVALMGGVSRWEPWRGHPHSVVVSIMGGCSRDLRSAAIAGAEVVFDGLALMGGVDIIVPEGVDVDLAGIARMGGKDSQVAPVPVRPGTPMVRVRARALMGSVVVRSRPPHDPTGETPGPPSATAAAAWPSARGRDAMRLERRLGPGRRRLARHAGPVPGPDDGAGPVGSNL
ncbi:MAG TPA: hypothetical protein VNN74_07000 [Candidatus Micrarchaeia archaeon]|nr:hypothetical protein [Candidatus Micrarchaeia archaeon]